MSLLKNRTLVVSTVIAIVTFGGQLLPAQAPDSNRVVVPIANPAQPVQIKAHLLNGSIAVKGYEGKEVIVEAKVRDDGRGEGEGRGRGHGEGRGGESKTENNMKRVPMSSTGLTIEAENNQVRIGTESIHRTVDLTLTVPVHSSLSLHTVNHGNITVNGVDGELDVDDINGEVTLTNISGSAVAHALNGRVLVTFVRVDAQKSMAFSSMNGNIDVTFPADFKANVNMRSDNGEVFSDFDIQLQTTATQPTVEDNRSKGGKYVVRIDKTVRGTINGGGQDVQFKNFNGNIYIRKAGAK
jgi:DUF4097 and DUF4098 domain-containing protein YvlB